MSVYFIAVGRYIKVGYSSNPQRRFERLFAGSTAYVAPTDAPHDLGSRQLLKVITLGDKSTERLIHGALRDFRVVTEWFIDEPELRRFITQAQYADEYDHLPRPAGPFDRSTDPVLGTPAIPRGVLQELGAMATGAIP